MEEVKQFKGWTKPGPVAPGENLSAIVPDLETLDAISGRFRLFQLKDGHRFSTDDLLAAWYGTISVPSAQRVLDLGSGVGTVGMIAAWRLQGASFVTIEAQEESVRLARKSAEYNGLTGRYEIRQGDFRDPAILGSGEKFDLILGSPPYFPLGTGVLAEHPQKIACRFEVRGSIQDYCEAASKHLAPGGVFVCVFPYTPEAQQERVLSAARDYGLSLLRQRPIILREGEAPLLAVTCMISSLDIPPSLHGKTYVEPPLIIRCKDGSVHSEYIAVKLSIGFPP